MGIYERQRLGKFIFLACSGVAIVVFLLISNNLVKQLAQQERERMNIWAQATQRLANAEADADMEFLLHIISQNNSIPVLVSDSAFNIIDFRNFQLPEKVEDETAGFAALSVKNQHYIIGRLKRPGGDTPLSEMAHTNPHFIEVTAYAGAHQYIYYEDSILLRRLSFYPYVQLGVMIVIALIIYAAVVYTKKAEQNRV